MFDVFSIIPRPFEFYSKKEICKKRSFQFSKMPERTQFSIIADKFSARIGKLFFGSLSMSFSCGGGNHPGDRVSMTATVTDIGERLTVEVTESEYTFGTHWVIVTDTKFYDKSGNKITKDAIKVGDSVKIQYSGQVMLSYPPQIVAAKITVL